MFLRAVSDRRWAGDAAPRAGASSPRSTFVTAVAGAGAATPTLVRIARGPLRGLLWAWLRLTLRISVQGAPTPGPAVIVAKLPAVPPFALTPPPAPPVTTVEPTELDPWMPLPGG